MSINNKLLNYGILLEYITLSWNVIGTVIIIIAARKAHSVALIGFGVDSFIEIGASTIVLWQLKDINKKDRERLALRLISVAFFLLSLYILLQSLQTLYFRLIPGPSMLGISWLFFTFAVMLALAFGKHRIGIKLDNIVLRTEARVTLVDAYLAGSVLLGLILNAIFKWWQADPLAGLVIVFYGCKESWHSWKESSATK